MREKSNCLRILRLQDWGLAVAQALQGEHCRCYPFGLPLLPRTRTCSFFRPSQTRQFFSSELQAPTPIGKAVASAANRCVGKDSVNQRYKLQGTSWVIQTRGATGSKSMLSRSRTEIRRQCKKRPGQISTTRDLHLLCRACISATP